MRSKQINIEIEQLKKKLKLIETQVEMHEYICDRQPCTNIAVCTYDSDYREHDNRTMLYSTDSQGVILDNIKPVYLHECANCANNAYFCSDSCILDPDLCYKCSPECDACGQKPTSDSCFCCAQCDEFFCITHKGKCSQCSEELCQKCVGDNGTCNECSI